MEPAIRDFFMAQYPGYELYYGAYDILYQSDRPWLFATLDGELTETDTGRKGILEIKTSTVMAAVLGLLAAESEKPRSSEPAKPMEHSGSQAGSLDSQEDAVLPWEQPEEDEPYDYVPQI
jgi:hypothetical protein